MNIYIYIYIFIGTSMYFLNKVALPIELISQACNIIANKDFIKKKQYYTTLLSFYHNYQCQ